MIKSTSPFLFIINLLFHISKCFYPIRNRRHHSKYLSNLLYLLSDHREDTFRPIPLPTDPKKCLFDINSYFDNNRLAYEVGIIL